MASSARTLRRIKDDLRPYLSDDAITDRQNNTRLAPRGVALWRELNKSKDGVFESN
jgi:hypothetical protein